MQMIGFLHATAVCIACLSNQHDVSVPRWSSDYGTQVSQARQEHRPLLLVLEDRRDPEKRLQRADAVSDATEASLLMRFELCRLDVNSESGGRIAEGYGVTEFPYTMITDVACERVVFRAAGPLNGRLWRQALNTYAGRERVVPLAIGETEDETAEAEPRQVAAFEHRSLDRARRAARRSQRPLIVYVSSDRCHFCERMQRETLTEPRVERAVESAFESVMIDRRDELEWTESQGLRIYPTTLVFSSNGKLIDRMEGFVQPADFVDRLKMTKRYLLSTLW